MPREIRDVASMSPSERKSVFIGATLMGFLFLYMGIDGILHPDMYSHTRAERKLAIFFGENALTVLNWAGVALGFILIAASIRCFFIYRSSKDKDRR